MKAYHNKGFGMEFFVVFLLLVPLPILSLWAVDGQDWVDRFTTKYFSPWQSECWETAKHERVCKGDNNCKWFRNFCHEWGTFIIFINDLFLSCSDLALWQKHVPKRMLLENSKYHGRFGRYRKGEGMVRAISIHFQFELGQDRQLQDRQVFDVFAFHV